jgi:hypothetical protein
MTIAKIIHTQLKQLDQMALWAWGTKDLVAMNDGLKFKTSGSVKWKGFFYIKYDEVQDLYNIDFFKICKMEIVYSEQLEGVFAEDMVRLIDEVVG